MSEELLDDVTVAPASEEAPASDYLGQVRQLVRDQLRPQSQAIDIEGRYPEDILRALGRSGGFGTAEDGCTTSMVANVTRRIEAMAEISKECLSTGFATWCQDTCAWYVQNSSNEALKAHLAESLVRGEALGGTGLSNPMKHFSGIEDIRLHASAEPGGYRINGLLPWVSNIGEGHYFGAVFRVDDEQRDVMAMIPCDIEGLTLSANTEFTALEGTATLACRFEDVFLPSFWVLAEDAISFLKQVQPGLVLTQMGMGLGLTRSCIELMREVEPRLAHVNAFLDDRPDQLAEEADDLEAAARELAKGVDNPNPDYMREILQLRLAGSELTLRAVQSAMLHTGASGYQRRSEAQRKLREGYFVAIVTPAIKHLRKEIAERLECRRQMAA
jgi:alkylation response protein AidB-like acyl-CoA dehydrogenase